MPDYNIYPSMDGDLNFPPSIREAIAKYPELVNYFAPKANPTFTGTVKGVTATMVGLSSVNNTSDANKPVSTAVAAAYVPKWKAGVAYKVGDQVIAPKPSDMVITCIVAHTASAAFPTDIVSKWNGVIYSGTTTERNAMFGTLTSVAQQVALANKQVSFYNTTEGWWESYYSPTGTGLTVKPLIAGNPAGWYPDPGSSIRAHRGQLSGFQSVAAGGDGLAPVLSPLIYNTGGKFTAVGNSGITPSFGGYYRISINGYFSGSTSLNVVANCRINSLSAAAIFRGSSVKQNAYDVETPAHEVIPLLASDTAYLVIWSITATSTYGTTGYNGNRFTIEYVGPPIDG